MYNIHFSGLDKYEFPSKLLLSKDMFTLTFVEHENETSIYLWELEKMNILK